MPLRKDLLRAGMALLVPLFSVPLGAQQPPGEHAHHRPADPPANATKHTEQEAVEAMTPGHHHEGPHIRLTALRAHTPEDLARADALVRALRAALEKYKDSRVAVADGYRPFLPNLPLPEYHFTNYWYGFLEALTFDPARPTSLLYKKTAAGYELAGAMYTMPRNATEDQLHARVPLSVGRWHAHVNLCLPPRGQGARADWTKFGLKGSIATPEACAKAYGRWFPQIFGWMIHVYPFEGSPEKVWGSSVSLPFGHSGSVLKEARGQN